MGRSENHVVAKFVLDTMETIQSNYVMISHGVQMEDLSIVQSVQIG